MASDSKGFTLVDGASISQFEQHIRAIPGWPLGTPVRHGPVTMTNLNRERNQRLRAMADGCRAQPCTFG
jgi:phosphoribosylaminoimidazole carboxylase (NCAIR synthetase)